jgi:DNA (cytosine-5)-methyltransferase 1
MWPVGGQRNPHIIGADDSDADGDLFGDAFVEGARRAADQKRRLIARAVERGAGADIIDLTKIEELAEEFLLDEIAEAIDLTSDLDGPGERRRTERSLGGDLLHRWVRDDGLALEIGTFVELEQPIAGRYPAEFFKVVEMVKSASGSVMLHGLGYARARHMEGMLARKMNEVCLLTTVDNADPQPWDAQRNLVTTRLSNVKRRRRLRTTNMAYPAHRYDVNEVKDLGTEWVADNCVLVCRYRYVEHFHGPATRKPCEWEFVRISEKEADKWFRVPDMAVLNEWRGGKIRGGSYMPGGSAAPVIDLESQLDGKLKLVPGQRYSAGDTFSGAGGAARGIERAGLQLVFGIDNWGPAVVSLERNFPDADILDMDIHDFVRSPATQYRVDMLHLSPPCQVWSPAHTIAGKDDDMNMAALYSCPELIAKVRPRLFTLEQTFGILHRAFSTYFNKLICGFTDHGYSVRWKIVHLATYGLAQPRRRLIIIGAGPGEVLPSFPPPTHSESGTGGLLPLVTARQALAPLARRRLGDDRLHSARKSKTLAPWNPDRPLPRTITCSGGENYHWLGKRDFTLLEYALLQGFPAYHRFGPTNVKKQIGNAFPSSVVQIFYKHLAAHLDECDNVDASTRAKPPSPPPAIVEDDTNPVELPDSDPNDLILLHVKRKFPKRKRSTSELGGSYKRANRYSGAWVIYDSNKSVEDPILASSSGEHRQKHQKNNNPIAVVDDDEDRERKDSQATIIVLDDDDKPVAWKGKGKETIAVGGDDDNDDDKLPRLLSSSWFLPPPTPNNEDPKTPFENELIHRHNGVTGGLLPQKGTKKDPWVIPE